MHLQLASALYNSMTLRWTELKEKPKSAAVLGRAPAVQQLPWLEDNMVKVQQIRKARMSFDPQNFKTQSSGAYG